MCGGEHGYRSGRLCELLIYAGLPVLFFHWPGWVCADETRSAPVLQIERELTNAGVVDLLRLQRRQCISERAAMSRAKTQWPEVWAGIRAERPQYDPDKPLVVEPDWRKLGIEQETEYFEGSRYAIYRVQGVSRIVDDGSCRISTKKRRSADIDDGIYAYSVDIEARTVIRTASPAWQAKQHDALFGNALEGLPGGAELLAKVFGEAGLPEVIETANRLVQKRQVMIIARQPARCVASGQQELCYWRKWPLYPGPLARPVILKAVTVFAGTRNVAVVTNFQEQGHIDPSVFQVPRTYRLVDEVSAGR